MQKVILTNYKLDSEPKLYQTKDKEHSYYMFFAVSSKPTQKGLFLKFSCQSWRTEAIERLKLHKGSVVDITADLDAFMKDGNYSYYLTVNDIAIADGLVVKKEREEAEKETPREKQAGLLKTLEDSPWGKGTGGM